MKTTFSIFLIHLLAFSTFLSCNTDRNQGALIDTEYIRIDTIIYNKGKYPNMIELYGILSIIPKDSSESISLANINIRDSIFGEISYKLPVLEETRPIETYYIDYNQRIIDKSSEPINWVKLRKKERNFYYFYGLAGMDNPNKEILYFKIPFMINGKKVDRVFKYLTKEKKFQE